MIIRRLGLLLVVGGVVLMAACGGGGGGGSNSSSAISSVNVSCSPSPVGSGGNSQCSASVTGTGSFNSEVTWTANAGSISSSGILTAPQVNGSGSPGGGGNSNVEPLVVDAGPDPQSFTSTNVGFVTVTVCAPGSTTQCQTIDHVMVDTGSIGLRLISGVLDSTSVSVTATSVQDPSKSGAATVKVTLLPLTAFNECLVFLDGYIWGPVGTADISFPNATAEVASAAAVQIIIPSSSTPAPPSSCSSQAPSGSNNEGGGSDADAVSTFGANGIIGVGLFQQDCGLACTSAGNSGPPAVYYSCDASGCNPTFALTTQQLPNPVTMFAVDNDGVLIQMPAVPNGGSPTVQGSLIFGIGTESNNGLGNAHVYQVPDGGNNAGNMLTTFNSQQYQAFVDSGSNGLFFLDSSVAGVPATCSGNLNSWYCPTNSPDNLTASNQGQDASGHPLGNPVQVGFTIENASNLFTGSNTAFSTLGGPLSNMFDWGLTFFYGRNMFTAIENSTAPGGTPPYFAF